MHGLTSCIVSTSKSQIAIEYSYRYRSKYPKAHIFWVHGGSHASFDEAYQQIGTALALPGLDDPNLSTLRLVQDWLNINAEGGWLIILDYMDDLETVFGRKNGPSKSEVDKSLIQYLPRVSAGSILITTRDRRFGERLVPGKKPITVEPLNMRDAEDLLNKKLPADDGRDEVLSQQLLQALDFLPPAITQATAFLTENEISVADYLEILQSSDSEMKEFLATEIYDPGRDAETSNSVLHTWKVSFDQIRIQVPLAADILSLMSCLDRRAVCEGLLCLERDGRIEYLSAIGTLKAFSLIKSEQGNKVFGMHRLVQLATQRWLELDGSVNEWQEKALSSVLSSLPKTVIFPWRDWETIDPHVMRVLSHNSAKESRSRNYWLTRASILHQHGEYAIVQGRIKFGHQQQLEGLSYREEFLEPNNVALLDSMIDSMRAFGLNPHMPENTEDVIQQLFKRSNDIVEATERHRVVHYASHQLGRKLIEGERWAEAEEIYRKLYEDRVYLSSKFLYQNYLMEALSCQGNEKSAEAEELHQRTMSELDDEGIGEKTLLFGLHFNTLYLRRTGKFDDALALGSRVVKGLRDVLGESSVRFKYVSERYQDFINETKNMENAQGTPDEVPQSPPDRAESPCL